MVFVVVGYSLGQFLHYLRSLSLSENRQILHAEFVLLGEMFRGCHLPEKVLAVLIGFSHQVLLRLSRLNVLRCLLLRLFRGIPLRLELLLITPDLVLNGRLLPQSLVFSGLGLKLLNLLRRGLGRGRRRFGSRDFRGWRGS